MKKTSIALLFTILITATCVFASCNGYSTGSDEAPESDSYESAIRELEDRILQLQRDQFIANSTREEQISKLEGMIDQLKAQNTLRPSPEESESDSDSGSGEDESEKESDAESESGSEKEEPETEFIYTVTDGVATITGYTGSDSQLTLPSQIDGYDVVAIGDSAFASKDLSSVIIPNGITKIGWFAFKGCESLYSVTIPDSVSSIGYDAFPRSSRMNIICSAESFAAKYAASYGLNTTLI